MMGKILLALCLLALVGCQDKPNKINKCDGIYIEEKQECEELESGKVFDYQVEVIYHTYPSFDYIKFGDKYYEAIPQIGNQYALGYQFKNKKEMDKMVKNSYPLSNLPISFYQEGSFNSEIMKKPVRFE